MNEALPSELHGWLTREAAALDSGMSDPEDVLPRLASADLFRVGIAVAHGGLGGTLWDAVEVLTALAEHSLTAAFVFWAQRTFVEYLLATPRSAPRERWLSEVLAGKLAGATGLSNAMKFLAGIEELGIRVEANDGSSRLAGRAPWVTNLRRSGFVVAVVAERAGALPWVLAVPSDARGVTRSQNLSLLGLQSSNTAALRFEGVPVEDHHLLHDDAATFVAAVRPAFLGLQCGLALGLARASLRGASEAPARGHVVLGRVENLQLRLDIAVRALRAGLLDARFVAQPRQLFSVRIELAGLAQAAVELELAASGGRAYLSEVDRGFGRRWREAAFIPIVTPSLLQLEQELARSSGGVTS